MRSQHKELEEYQELRLQHSDEYPDVRLQHKESDEQYHAGRLQEQENEQPQGGKSKLYCPVDQLMQAAETVV